MVDTQEYFSFLLNFEEQNKAPSTKTTIERKSTLPRDFHRWTAWNDDCEADCENARSKRHFRIFPGNTELSFRIFLVL